MLSRFYIRQTHANQRLILGVVALAMVGLLITISVLMHNPLVYWLVAALVLLSMIHSSLRVTSHWLEIDRDLARKAVRYRLAWLSARNRARYYDASVQSLLRNNFRHGPN